MAEEDTSSTPQFTTKQRAEILKNVGIGTSSEREAFLDSAERLIRLYAPHDPGPVLDASTYRKAVKDLQSAASKLSRLLSRPLHQTLSGLPEEEVGDLLDKLAWIQSTAPEHLNLLESHRHEHPGKTLLQALATTWQEIFRKRPGHSARSQFVTAIDSLRDTGGVDLPTVKKRMLQ